MQINGITLHYISEDGAAVAVGLDSKNYLVALRPVLPNKPDCLNTTFLNEVSTSQYTLRLYENDIFRTLYVPVTVHREQSVKKEYQ